MIATSSSIFRPSSLDYTAAYDVASIIRQAPPAMRARLRSCRCRRNSRRSSVSPSTSSSSSVYQVVSAAVTSNQGLTLVQFSAQP